MGLLFRLLNWSSRRKTEQVIFDDDKVTHSPLRGEDVQFYWKGLSEVSIETTDQGPFVDDVFWVLSGNGMSCRISNAAKGMDELLRKLKELPGFDYDVAIVAMAMASNAKFECWRRQEPAPVDN